jgi:hypothetical protein
MISRLMAAEHGLLLLRRAGRRSDIRIAAVETANFLL